MKLIAIHTINLGGGKFAVPGEEFERRDEEGKALIAEGAAARKTRQVADDGDDKVPLAEVIALADQQGVTLSTLKKAAGHHLTAVPDKKEDVVAALRALPPETPVQ